ncbi:MAG: ACP S-malonyltransferase [Alphaproteobacteria bacterium]
MRAFVFPGQGSQAIGMGKELHDSFLAAKEVFQEVDDSLSQSLYKLMTEGTIEELTLTENTQPALMAVSMAVIKVLEKEAGVDIAKLSSYVLGHSLGEYSALCAAGVFSLSDTAKLLKTRGLAMQQAVPKGLGGMAAVMGVNLDKAKELAAKAAEDQVCVAANDNADGQIVISGHMEAIDRAVAIASEFGAKRCIKLAVSAPFHCSLMKPAAEKMQEALDNVTMNNPRIPVIANVTAAETTDTKAIKKLLVEQVTGSVRWRESMLYLKERSVDNIIEAGSGKVLSGLSKRILPDAQSLSISSPQDIENFIKTL